MPGHARVDCAKVLYHGAIGASVYWRRKLSGSDSRNQIEAGGKTDRGVGSFSGGYWEAVAGNDLCGFESDNQKRKMSFNVVYSIPYH
jgi:hypothetical protein